VSKDSRDVVIIGAGVAGLAAAGVLARAGQSVLCLEARDRIGGRILTVHDPLSPVAIELGAEFVHGRPPALWDLIRDHHLLAYEHGAEAWHLHRGRAEREKQVGNVAGRVIEKMAKSRRKKDEAFETYLRRSNQPPRAAAWARGQVEGFNAAPLDRIGAASLAEDADAAKQIGGDRFYRLPGGYDQVLAALLCAIPRHSFVLALNSIAHSIRWRRGHAVVQYRSVLDHRESTVTCRRVVITVPLGVLKASPSQGGSIAFEPDPRQIRRAASKLEMGHVDRLTLRYREPFWEDDEKFRNAGFLISGDTPFMTWWTTWPVVTPLLTAWSAGSRADLMPETGARALVDQALTSLARMLRRRIPAPEAVFFHDWQADPFARGAYSYVPAGSSRAALGKPVEETLFFAGEAASRTGRGGTVDGAIESGIQAAEAILRA
jgi:monoamine oxidase